MDIISDEIKRVRFKKLQSNYIIKILAKNNYQLTNDEWLDLLSKSGYNSNYLTLKRVKRIMGTDVVRQDTDNKLVYFYAKHNITESRLSEILEAAIKSAKNKENSSVLFQIYQHLESKFYPESKVKVTEAQNIDLGSDISSITRTVTKELNQ